MEVEYDWTDAEQEKVRLLADRITPKSWHIMADPGDFKFIPGTLNINFWFLYSDYGDGDYIDDCRLGEVHGPMYVYPISFFKDQFRDAEEAVKKYGDGFIANVEIRIYPSGAFWDLEGTVIHELAHVAVARYQMWQQKPQKNNMSFALEREDDMHGPLFQRFYRIMLNRTKKVFGEEMVKHQWKHLTYFENGWHKEEVNK